MVRTSVEYKRNLVGHKIMILGVSCLFVFAISIVHGFGNRLSMHSVTVSEELVDGPWTNYRLPSYIIPMHYKLKLHPNMTTDTYTGTNAMSINITQSTQYILVHVDEKLEILSTKLQLEVSDGSLQDIDISNTFRYPQKEYYAIDAGTMLSPSSNYILTMEFQSSLVLRIAGLYKSTYTVPETGETKAIVASHMDPTYARKAYPCFDEPALKIRYSVTLVHEPHHNALSNMDISNTFTRHDGLLETVFNMSPQMSTYLSCFVISEYVYKEKRSASGNIPLRVYVTPHQLAAGQAEYALKVMKIQFDFFESYFGMNYPLPKCDMISIPDFMTGAMENWGLITSNEINLLWDPKESSTSNKQKVAAVVSHELVHQWMGDLVTEKWWNNVWLSEGFANNLQNVGIDASEPDWKYLKLFTGNAIQEAMSWDASMTSHPVVVPVETPSEITTIFDAIIYNKASSVIRVMQEKLGLPTFTGGIRNYLKKHQFSNAVTKDLFDDMQEFVDMNGNDINVAEEFNPWIFQTGFPVIMVSGNQAEQRQFLLEPNANLDLRDPSPYNYKWNVDITFVTSKNSSIQRQRLWIANESVTLNVGSLTRDDWIKLNVDGNGYYRVNYDDTMWTTISQQLLNNHLVFSGLDRSNLIDDVFNLARAMTLRYPLALNMTRYLGEERSIFVWKSVSSGSAYIARMLANTSVYSKFQIYYRRKVKPTADSLGWNATIGSHMDKLNRVLVLGLALEFGDRDAMNNATKLFNLWINDPTYYLQPDIRQLVYQHGISTTGVSEWEIMFQRYLQESVASEKANLLIGLASSRNVYLIDRMLEYSKNESIIKTQHFFIFITSISHTAIGNMMSWDWVQLNWEYMVNRFGIANRLLGRLIPSIVSSYNTKNKLMEVLRFFLLYPEAGAGASWRVRVIDSIQININWVKDCKAVVGQWFEDNA